MTRALGSIPGLVWIIGQSMNWPARVQGGPLQLTLLQSLMQYCLHTTRYGIFHYHWIVAQLVTLKPMIRHRFHESPSTDTIQLKPVHIFILYFFWRSILILPSHMNSGLSSDIFSGDSLIKHFNSLNYKMLQSIHKSERDKGFAVPQEIWMRLKRGLRISRSKYITPLFARSGPRVL
jgi:hypothetical protein